MVKLKKKTHSYILNNFADDNIMDMSELNENTVCATKIIGGQ